MINAIDRLRFGDIKTIPEGPVTKPQLYRTEYDMMVRADTKKRIMGSLIITSDEQFCSNVPYKWPVWVGGNYDFSRRQSQPFHKMRELRATTMLEE